MDMLKIESTSATDLPKCFICDGVVATSKKCRSAAVAQTLTLSMTKILEACLQHLFADIDNESFCGECIQRIQQYDELVQLSKQIESELFEAYQRKSLNNYFIVEDAYNDDAAIEMHAEEVMIDEYIDANEDDIGKEIGIDDDKPFVVDDGNAFATENVKLEIEHVLPNEVKYRTRSHSVRRKTGPELDADAQVKSTPEKAAKTAKTTKREYKCPVCKAPCRNRSDRTNHIKLVHGGEKVEMVCDICGQSYKSKKALEIHIGMHRGFSPHACHVCGKKFTQKGALVRHMPLHTGEKPYQCDKCGKRFIHYSSFHMHQLAHNNIREKKCDVCGLELLSSSHLSRHMRIHTGEKPYECPICSQRFAQRYNMTTHVKAHQGIHRTQRKTIACSMCNSTFNRQGKLKAHMSSQHGITDAVTPNHSTTKEDHTAMIVVEKAPSITAIEIKMIGDHDPEYVLTDSSFIH